MANSSLKDKNLLDIRQSLNYAKYLKTQGWIVERIDNTNYFIKKIPIIGAFLKIQRPKEVDFKTIEKLQKKYRVFQTIIEPNLSRITVSLTLHKIFISKGYKLSKSPYLPTKTIHIDLTQSVKQITANMDKKTRYGIRRGERVKVVDYSDIKKIKKFHQGWKNCVKFSRYVPTSSNLINLRKAFPSTHSIFLASHNINNEIIGGAVFTRSYKDFSYYWFGFTNKEGRSSLSQYSLLYRGILWGKKQGCKFFDVEGIYDNRFPQKSWLGFSHFKKGFGLRRVSYPNCYTKNRLPI